MKISRFRCAMALLACLGASQANAQLLNISTQALQSQNTPAVACTIVGTTGNTWHGLKALVVLSEATSADSNPRLVVRSLENNETMANDDWGGTLWHNGAPMQNEPQLVTALLRAPMRPSDAAVVLSVPPGWRVCASSTETSGGDTLRRANVQFTDVTDAAIAVVRSAPVDAATLKAVPADTPNLMATFARAFSER